MDGDDYPAGRCKDLQERALPFGEGYEHFYFLTNDYHGETLLWLLCHPEIIGQLNAMLLQELQPPCRNAFIENDARTDAGAPILFCYLPDLPRLFRFLSALNCCK